MEGKDELVSLGPGVTLVLPANLKHWFRAIGDRPLIHNGNIGPRGARLLCISTAACSAVATLPERSSPALPRTVRCLYNYTSGNSSDHSRCVAGSQFFNKPYRAPDCLQRNGGPGPKLDR